MPGMVAKRRRKAVLKINFDFCIGFLKLRFTFDSSKQNKPMTRKQAIQKQLDHAKSILTEKGYRDFIKRWVTLSTEYFQNGGTFNIADYEHKQPPVKMKRYYFENAILCGNCNGSGLQGHLDYCRACGTAGIVSMTEFFNENKKVDLITLSILYKQSFNLIKQA